MTSRDRTPPGAPQGKPRADAAKDRLAAALRENLKRRKAQERARDGKTEPSTVAPPAKSEEDR